MDIDVKNPEIIKKLAQQSRLQIYSVELKRIEKDIIISAKQGKSNLCLLNNQPILVKTITEHFTSYGYKVIQNNPRAGLNILWED